MVSCPRHQIVINHFFLLSLATEALLDGNQLAKRLLELRNLQQTLEVSLNARRGVLLHLGIQQQLARQDQGTSNHDIRNRHLLTNQELAVTLGQSVLDMLDSALKLLGRGIIALGGVGNQVGPVHHQHARVQVGQELLLGEAGPLLDQGTVDGSAAEELLGLGARVGEEAHDGLALGQVEGAIGGGEGGDLAVGELGEDGGPLGVRRVGELEVAVFNDLKAVELGDGLGLEGSGLVFGCTIW